MLRSLNALLSDNADRSICRVDLNNRETISLRQFIVDLASLKVQVETADRASWLLYADSTYNFALGLLALLGLKKTVLICASSKPGWLAQFEDQFEAVVSDCPLGISGKPRVDFDFRKTSSAAVGNVWTPVFDGTEQISFFTSGSTGEPKRIQKELTFLLREVQTLEAQFGNSIGPATFAASVSHSHIYGLLFKLLWPMLTRRMWLERQIDYPEQLLRATQWGENIVFVSSPALLSHLDVSLPAVAVTKVFSSGGPLPYPAAMDARAWLTQLPIEIYGSTETGGIAHRQQTSADAVWTLFPDVTLHATGNQMVLLSPHLPGGESAVLDDIILIESEGSFRLRGRKDRVVKIAEKRVSLTGIERRAESLDSIERCVALSLRDGRQTIGCAVLVSETGATLLAEQGLSYLVKLWKQAMATHFDRVAVPRKWRILERLPVNSQGKIDAAAIAALFERPGRAGVDLPTVLGVGPLARGVELDLQIETCLNVFDGHFDNAPIVPGVVQIKWAIELGRQYLGHLMPAGPGTLLSVKFQNVIHPGQQIKMSLEIMNDRLEFVVSSPRGKHSSGKIALP